ncbi:MAG: Bifunctional IPC transferase and DIPP synthase [Candidatus Methanolliviera sp. GoM_oil]|nr:MAG: Bifunctional IPC transferase and DIPP synthase [Candidatus Methanolliviera sp. GoM_oil]
MKAIILAAGKGKRLNEKEIPKPAVNVCGVPLILRNIFFLKKLGLDVVVVGGHKFDRLREILPEDVELIKNNSIERGNAFSVLCAQNKLKGRFLVLMGDHVYTEEFLRKTLNAPANSAIVSKESDLINIDTDEATKILAREGKIVDIGKEIEEWNYIDTGAFLCEDSIFKTLNDLFCEENHVEWSDVINRSDMNVYENEELWMDVDTKEDLKRAEDLLMRSLKKDEDGFISRHINRRFSRLITKRLVNFNIEPNLISIFSFILCIASSLFFYGKILWIGGILAQFSSVLDGCDGEIARLKLKESKFGGFLDSILDRYGDAMIILGMFSLLKFNFLNISILVAALFGSLTISSTAWRFESDFREKIHTHEGWLRYIPAKRDERMFIIFLGGILGTIWLPAIFWSLFIIAILSNLRIIGRVLIARKMP